jgi:hypothetical protein
VREWALSLEQLALSHRRAVVGSSVREDGPSAAALKNMPIFNAGREINVKKEKINRGRQDRSQTNLQSQLLRVLLCFTTERHRTVE